MLAIVVHACNYVLGLYTVYINRILSDLKTNDDPVVAKCLTRNYKGSSSGLIESYEVAEIRLEYLKKSKR
jgi:hypothetical protein